MAKLQKNNEIWILEFDNRIENPKSAKVFFSDGAVAHNLPVNAKDSTLFYVDPTGAILMLSVIQRKNPLQIIVQDTIKQQTQVEDLFVKTDCFSDFVDLAGADFYQNWSNKTYKKARDIAIFSRVYNEYEFVEIFCKYYSSLTNPKNIFFIDHSSDDTSYFDTVKRYGCQLISLPRGETDEHNMKTFCEYFQRFLLTKYAWVIYADIDELLVFENGVEALRERILSSTLKGIYKPQHAYEIVEETEKEPDFEFSKQITSQRDYLVPHEKFYKPLITSAPANWSPGFHAANNPNIEILENLWLIHVSYISLDYRVRRQVSRSKEVRSAGDASYGLTVGSYEGLDTQEAYKVQMSEWYQNRIYHNSKGGESIRMPIWMKGMF